MSIHFDIDKDTAKVKFILDKRNLPKITAEVVGILDVSGSTRAIYYNGTVQNALQRIIPVALNFDDNGSVPVYVFNDGDDYFHLETEMTAANYSDFVTKHIITNTAIRLWGGTAYAGVLHSALQDLGFYKKPAAAQTAKGFFKKLFASDDVIISESFREQSNTGLPAIINFITDGENEHDDRMPTRELLKAAQLARSNVYFNFIGVGNASFSFLREIADEYDNTGFAQITDIERTAGSDDIYEFLLPHELTEWLRAGATVKVGGQP